MKKYAHFSLIAVSALLVLFAISSYSARVSTAGEREVANPVIPTTLPGSADLFETGRLYDLAISDAGSRTVYRCRVVQTRSNWVFCQASWRTGAGVVQNGNLWLNADHMAVVRLAQ